jgi:HAMP domain-containing protein
MKESFETNLDTSQTDEKSAKETYSSMKASKEEEIKAGQELIDAKTSELASTDEKNVASKEDLADTTAAVDADTKFLANLKDKCDSAQADYNARSKVRNDEIQAVAEAMEILTGDDAKDLLLKFVQVSSLRETRSLKSRTDASKFVAQMAKKTHSPKLSALSVSMRLDAFTKVKENIDKMVAELKQTQKDEVVKKDLCGKELHENEMQTTEGENKKADLTALIQDLETSKTTLAEEIEALKAEVAETQTQYKRASELRLQENKEFQITVTDQKATQEILAKALNRLKAFYDKKSFLQTRLEQPGYKKNAGSSSVMVMMENIIEESKAEQESAIKAENDAVAAYAQFTADTTQSIEAMQRSIISKTEELAKVDGSKAEAEGDLQATNADLLALLKTYQTLHSDCDFLLKYFDVRQTKRAEEIEALQQAKAIFSGAGR